MPPGSTFEADLRAVREARGLSLDDIQRETRIPVDVLRRFEEGDLVGDPTYNPVYLKAFLQSYARAVGLTQGDVMAAYEAHERGAYRGELHPNSDAAPAPPPATSAPAEPEVAPVAERAEPEAERPPPAARSSAPAVQALANASSEPEPTTTEPEVPTQPRVSRPSVTTARRSFDKNWGLIIGLGVVLTLVIGAVIWFLIFADDDAPEADGVEAVAVGGAAIDTAGVGAGAAAGGPQLQLPLVVTVRATGGPLQNFRVTEAPEERRPYWIEQGDEQTFESDSLLIFWGEGAEGLGPNTTLEFQGQRFTPADGSVLRISAATGQRLLDSLAGVTPPAPVE